MAIAAAALTTMLCTSGAAAGQSQIPPPHAPVPFDQDVRTWVVPALREWRGSQGVFRIAPGARVVYPTALAKLGGVAVDLAADIRALTGIYVKVVTGSPAPGDIVLSLTGMPSASAPEAYGLTIDRSVLVSANTENGVRLGSQSLLQLLKRSADHRTLPQGSASDWPDQPMRAMFVDVGRKFYQVSELDDLMRQMAYLKLNTLGLHFTDWPAFRLRSEKFPGLADRLSYGRADIDHLERTAERYGITIIPEIDLPAHSTALIKYRPSLAFKCESMRQSEWQTQALKENAAGLAWTVDITKPDNRAFLESLYREFIPWFRGEYFHIGGDEYQYDVDKNRCPELVAYAKVHNLQFPGDVFVDWINDTDALVRSMGKKTAIWTWWRFKDDKTSIEPNKDILVYTWNAPRQADILAKGYKIMVTPETMLYVSPGVENWDGSGYGRFNSTAVYGQMAFPQDPKIAGYMVELWADATESATDRAMLARAYEPMAVLSERTWSGAGASASLDAFLDRLNQSSAAPRRDTP